MKKKLFFVFSELLFCVHLIYAQSPQTKHVIRTSDEILMSGLDINNMETSFMLNVNPMTEETKEKLNRVASNYRSRNRSVLKDLGKSMLTGGVAAVVNVFGTEIINLTQIRSKQKKAWEQMNVRS